MNKRDMILDVPGQTNEDTMATVSEIQKAILGLSEAEYAELRDWLLDEDWERWERKFEEDVKAGRLDFLKAEALEAKARGELNNL